MVGLENIVVGDLQAAGQQQHFGVDLQVIYKELSMYCM
jgi:hypothetical protein